MTSTKHIDNYISQITDWRGERLAQLRKIIHTTDPEIQEDWKWDVPIFVHGTMVCAISAFNDHVKINFFKGAKLSDPKSVFNSGLDSKQHRSINLSKTDEIPEDAITDFIHQALLLNKK